MSDFPEKMAQAAQPAAGSEASRVGPAQLQRAQVRERSEAALAQSEALLALGQGLSSTGTFSWRVAGDQMVWSAELYRIFELDPLLPVDMARLEARVHEDDLSSLADALDRARRTGTAFEHELRLLMSNQSVKYVRVVAQPAHDGAYPLEYIGAVQDVTAQRIAEKTLGEAQSELAHVNRILGVGVLTASITHELNQPLTGIATNASTCLRMLASEPPNLDGARETVRRVLRDGKRAADVIQRLRALFSKHEFAIEQVDLNDATREVLALSANDLQRTHVAVHAELADELPKVLGDRVQLQQVIVNLVLNAADAMSGVQDRPRQLTVRTERDERNRLRLTVRDSGVGFDPRNVDRLFEAFYTTKNSGMGVGLSVSRSIVESQGGRLWAAPNDGPGATFSLSLPALGVEARPDTLV